MPSSIIGAVASTVIGSALADDHGAEAANASAADAARAQAAIGLDQWDRYKRVYAPLEDRVVAEAQDYDTPENYAKAAGEASATVSSQFGKARNRLARTPGLDPSSPAYAATLADLDSQQAAVDATQQNAARQRVKDMAWARKVDALGLGKGLPATASGMLASSARQNIGLAEYGSALGEKQAGAIGRIVNIGLDSLTQPRTILSGNQTVGLDTHGGGFSMVDSAYDNFA